MIFRTLDCPDVQSEISSLLTWIPAHGSASSTIGIALRSDGRQVSAVDWRANRLVDAAAKAAAAQERVPEGIRNF